MAEATHFCSKGMHAICRRMLRKGNYTECGCEECKNEEEHIAARQSRPAPSEQTKAD